jgi:hypothetical protein
VSWLRGAGIAVALAVLASACSLVQPAGPLGHCVNGERDEDETDVDCGGECGPCPYGQICAADADCATHRCSAGKLCDCPTDMKVIHVTRAEGVTFSYCIDRTEVSHARYDAFVASAGAATAAHGACRESLGKPGSLAPEPGCADPRETPEHPVRGVTWCQADAFCRSEKRRLCGGLGGTMSVVPTMEIATFLADDEWYHACYLGGFAFAGDVGIELCLGDIPAKCPSGTCLDAHCTARLDPVGTLAVNDDGGGNCKSVSELLHLGGNVREWVAGCEDYVGATDGCLTRGGCYASVDICESLCTGAWGGNRHNFGDPRICDFGIRCCAG